MQEKDLFEYAVVRVLPRVERGEFINVGVIVYCATQQFLRAQFELREERLRAFSPGLSIPEIQAHLQAIERTCVGGAEAGPIGKMPPSARFHWLTAPRSTIVQTSPVHTGVCLDAHATLAQLLTKLVR
jgi:hypothetical protein